MSVGGFYPSSRQQASFSFLQEEADAKFNVPRLPLFSRCPITNQARLEDPRVILLNTFSCCRTSGLILFCNIRNSFDWFCFKNY